MIVLYDLIFLNEYNEIPWPHYIIEIMTMIEQGGSLELTGAIISRPRSLAIIGILSSFVSLLLIQLCCGSFILIIHETDL